jgi:DNA-binding CsgD family transcriptional regulator
VRVRVLCPDAVPRQREYLTLLAGYAGAFEPRVSRHDWPEQVVVDERVAVLFGRGAEAAATPVVVRARPVVATLAAVFTGEWEAAARLPAPVPDESRLATEPARRILDLLGAGYRDAAAARELGLSIRTYRRHVAELMTELRAGSRFQAGARAAHLGLLPQEVPSPAS